jgi:hypothetical protein
MVALSKEKRLERKATMQKGTRDEIVKVFEAELEEWARNLLESLMPEKRAKSRTLTPATSLPS